MKKIILLLSMSFICVNLYSCSDKLTEKKEEGKTEYTNNYDENKKEDSEEENKEESNIKDGIYEVDVREVMNDRLKVNITRVVKETSDKGDKEDEVEGNLAIEILDAVEILDNDEKIIRLSKDLIGKHSVKQYNILRIKVESGEIIELDVL